MVRTLTRFRVVFVRQGVEAAGGWLFCALLLEQTLRMFHLAVE